MVGEIALPFLKLGGRYQAARLQTNPDNLNDTEFNARLFKALNEHAALIAAQGIRLDRWGIETGAEGGISLFDGGNHYRFAVQVANEKLKSKTVVKSYGGEERFAYKWQTKNPHDFCDVLAMCYALAGADGVNGEVQTAVKCAPKHKRRVYQG